MANELYFAKREEGDLSVLSELVMVLPSLLACWYLNQSCVFSRMAAWSRAWFQKRK